MSIDNEPLSDYDLWVKVRDNPENPNYDVDTLDVSELPYYRLQPGEEEFCDGPFSVTVGVCGYHGYLPFNDYDLHPDTHADHVLLGINGTHGTRLVNVLLSGEEAQQVVQSLGNAMKRLER